MRGEREKTNKVLKEIMAENFPNLARNVNLQIKEAEQIPNRINAHTHTINTKMNLGQSLKTTEKAKNFLKAVRKKHNI